MPGVILELTIFLSLCYGYPQANTMAKARQCFWLNMMEFFFKKCRVYQQQQSFIKHMKNAHLQVSVACFYEWVLDEHTQSLALTTVLDGIALVPTEMLKHIKCQCENEKPCSSMRCGCNRARLVVAKET